MEKTKKEKNQEGGDDVLKRMLKTPPKPHDSKEAREDDASKNRSNK